MAIIHVDDAYILNETGAQVDKVTGLFTKNENATTDEKQMARLNIAAGGSNRNLLDNAYFVGGGSQLGDGVFPINQRGQASYSAYTNSIDRWYAAAAMTVAADGISCGAIVQKIPQVANLNGKTLTFSALLADGTMLSGHALFNSASDTYFYYDAEASEYLFYNTYFGGFEVVTAKKIAAVKLELGTVSTLANDAPPDFGEELRKCQRYLLIRDYAQNDVIANGLTNNLTMFLPTSMRSGGSPTMTFTATPYVIGNGVISTPTSVGLVSVNGNQVQIYAPTTESHNAQTIVLYAGSATRMIIANEP